MIQMIAAIYVRVSTEGQIDGYSISAQISEITEYAKKSNLNIFGVYSDEGLSGKKEDRPQFQKMIHDAEKGLFNIILVHKFDRFARRIELSHKIKNQLKKASVNVISITEPIEDSPIGFFQEGLLELLAEYYTRNLAKEVSKGQQERVLQGLPSGSVPYGYKNMPDGKVELVPEQAEWVKKIFELYANGTTIYKICQILNSSGIKNKRNLPWEISTISRMLTRVTYIGQTVYKGNVYPSSVPAIVDEEIFNVVQNMKGNKKDGYKYRSDNKSKLVFAGMIRCEYCKKAMQIHSVSKNKDIKYYHCRDGKYNKCEHDTHYRCEKLEEKIIRCLYRLVSKITYVETKENINLGDVFEQRKAKLTNELKRAKEAYLAEVFTLEEYSELKNRLEAELKDIKPIPSQTIDAKGIIKNMIDKYKHAETVLERQKIVATHIKSVYIGKKTTQFDFIDF